MLGERFPAKPATFSWNFYFDVSRAQSLERQRMACFVNPNTAVYAADSLQGIGQIFFPRLRIRRQRGKKERD